MKPRSANCSFSSNPLTPPTINNMKNSASEILKQIDELKTAQQTKQDTSKESEPQEGGS